MLITGTTRSTFLYLALLTQSVAAYQLLISDSDQVRQVCTGMWAKGGTQEPFIEGNLSWFHPSDIAVAHTTLSFPPPVIFSPSSRGQVALAVFEWEDAKYLGVDPTGNSTENSWSDEVSRLSQIRCRNSGPRSRGSSLLRAPLPRLFIELISSFSSFFFRPTANLHLYFSSSRRHSMYRIRSRKIHHDSVHSPFRKQHLHGLCPLQRRSRRLSKPRRRTSWNGTVSLPREEDGVLLCWDRTPFVGGFAGWEGGGRFYGSGRL